ncbi:uncharacterized protein N7479_008789 [Penicillium vulpinum]|uniref:Peptidase A1 domain-containing protein n=1 Tax=Penicillium vulpinum TaxID=29845 RepID=A0A1V6S256_9EURO|nr:uncharacterized protein N7479_008789 [Penicillium vulpinum]KAJ5950376.1 hypothetical protein N7479_008789 [Penicillium vulpinum]OQE07824.1 hypothetical protein PENVUL_c012G00394 [Penicillium vulpinum]
MRQSLIALWVWSWACAGVGASDHTFPLVKRDVPAVVGMDLYPHQTISRLLKARDTTTIQTTIGNTLEWFANVSTGTPPQPLAILVDIEHNEFTVVLGTPLEGDNCQEDSYCRLYGAYNLSQSSSANSTIDESKRKWSYTFDVTTDIVTMGETQVKDVKLNTEFIVGNANIMGLSPNNESFPYQLVDRGLIRSPSFSVWGNASSDGGAGLLFGGVNKAKYHGPLQAFPFNKTSEVVTLPLSGFQIQSDSKEPTTYTFPSSKPFILSTRYITTTLPDSVIQQIYKDYNITMEKNGPVVDCTRLTENHTISLSSGNATFSVPWSELIGYRDPTRNLCRFYIESSDEDAPYAGTIGIPFSHRMYIALNYNSGFVGVAPLNENPGPDEILEIGDGPDIPDAEGDFPTSILPYPLLPTVAASTSTGLAAMPTYMPGGMLAVAGAALMAAL